VTIIPDVMTDEYVEVYKFIGLSLLMLQSTENHIAFCMTYIFPKGKILVILDNMAALEAEDRRKTTGQLISALRQRVQVDSSFDDTLSSFIENRNRFVHRLTDDPKFDLYKPDGRRKIMKFLNEFNSQMEVVAKVFMAFELALFDHLGIKNVTDLDHPFLR